MTAATIRPVDPDLTRETRNLLHNLHALSGRAIMIGHQDATAYGIGWSGDDDRSDMKSVCGSHPAVYGWDFGNPEQTAGPALVLTHRRAIEAFQRGGVNTFCWHMNNPVSGGNFYDLTPAVRHILPGGSHHHVYHAELQRVAEFAHTLRTPDGTMAPVIFRPFHEHNGSWFWWGRSHCTTDEFIELWRHTVHVLRDELGVHNFLYAYSPDVFASEEDYLERYPGDEYVDVLGHDNYRQAENPDRTGEFIEALRGLVNIAQRRGKLPTLTETGQERIPDSHWWTSRLAEPILRDPIARRISWILLWRNANPRHHYAPHPGHPSAADFESLTSRPGILMQGNVPAIYADE